MEENSSLLEQQQQHASSSEDKPGPAGGSGGGGAKTNPLRLPRQKFEGFENLYNFGLESLDYDLKVVGSAHSTRVRPTYMAKLLREAMKWGVCLLVGTLTAVIAFSVNVGVENIAGFKFWLTFSVMNGRSGSLFGGYLLFAFINCILAGLASAVVVYYGPGAAGSGIPDVKSYLNGVDLPNVLSPQTLVAKILGSVGAVSASLAVGKEGPFVHIGACLAYLLTQGEKVHNRLKHPLLNVFRDDRQLRDFVTCGAAAGVAAAFRAPVGGVLFALEEATSWWRNQILWLAFFTTAVVSVVLRSMIRHCHVANCGFFGAGGFILFSLDEGQDSYEIFELLPMLLLGVMGGLLGSTFNVLNAQLTLWRQSFFRKYGARARVIEAVIIALLTSTVAFGLPLMVSCQNCPHAHTGPCPRNSTSFSGNYVQFNCRSDTEHNDMATLFFNTQDDAIRSLLSSKNNKEYSVSTLLGYFVSFFTLATLTYGAAIPSGLFVPSILCGASYGRLVGMFVIRMHPNYNIDEGTYALLGAAGFLGGASRMTVSLCVIMLELTNNMALLPLIMLVLLVAKGVGDGSGIKAIYDIHVDLKGVPFLESQPQRFMQHISAKEICSHPVSFRRFESVSHIKNVLGSNKHNGFPVFSEVDSEDVKLLGIVLRSNLERVLRIQNNHGDSVIPVREEKHFNGAQMSAPYDEALGTIDLMPMVDSSHFVVDEDMPTSKVYKMLRELALRHVLVVPRTSTVTGVITRKDLLPDVLEGMSPSRNSNSAHLPYDEGERDSRSSMRRRALSDADIDQKGD